ncbi:MULTISPECIES: hypothetical protein [Alcaligenes]|jgi:hypothetical protein|uniref:Uncharacterized protein n=1 Tax=Alcaligenes aquatilis TaxID=323284 RepID=A0A3G2HRT1_9BURK|nr:MULTISPECIES: hypothetical protein [Alcaligenes]AWG35778.1 hypothetical protein CA948_12000 [Alcaligenes aquatilis]AYN19754.1 hypothetical protein D3M96_03885 [Alcaligenes aquatilis]MCC9163670.1 hypothetical protein [Alcaligenes sp. MMA]MCH4223503.1 hypothetical protein [Alcaligenes faecalis]QXR36592.1 hypothetical protein EGK70_003360 [Alcaligenes aquatilis]
MFKVSSFLLSVVVLGGSVLPTTASAADRRVKLVNKSGVTLVEFHASRSKVGDWEENIIAGQPLRSGQSMIVNVDDGTGACEYDFMGTFSDGDVVTSMENDVCVLEEFTFE